MSIFDLIAEDFQGYEQMNQYFKGNSMSLQDKLAQNRKDQELLKQAEQELIKEIEAAKKPDRKLGDIVINKWGEKRYVLYNTCKKLEIVSVSNGEMEHQAYNINDGWYEDTGRNLFDGE